MLYLLKYFFGLSLFTFGSILLCQIGQANYQQFLTHSFQDYGTTIDAHLNTTLQAFKHSWNIIKENNWQEFILVHQLDYLFHHKVYWIVLVLLLLICYYELRKRLVNKPKLLSVLVKTDEHRQQIKRQTQQKLAQLQQSPQYKDYVAKKKNQLLQKPQEQPEDEDFIKDWQENEKNIYPQL